MTRTAEVWWLVAGVLAACRPVAHAFPGPAFAPPFIVSPTSNGSNSATVTATVSVECDASCTVSLPAWSALSWVRTADLVYSTTMTVATKMFYVDRAHNYTITSTTYNSPPPRGYIEQTTGTNDQGTVFIPLKTADGYTQLAYPTAYYDYADSYQWEGVLPSTDRSSNVVCETSAPTPIQLPEHPAYPPLPAGRPDPEDPKGTGYTLLWILIPKLPSQSFFASAFPSESAFSSCMPAPAPTLSPSPITTALYLTASITSYRNLTTYPIVHTEKTETGFEPPSTTHTAAPQVPHTEVTKSGFSDFGPPVTTDAVVRIQPTASGFEEQSSLTTGYPPPVVHTENTEPGFDTTTPAESGGGPAPPAQETRNANMPPMGVDGTSVRPAVTQTPGLPELLLSILTNPIVASAVSAYNAGTNVQPALTQTPGLPELLLNVLTNPAVISAVSAYNADPANPNQNPNPTANPGNINAPIASSALPTLPTPLAAPPPSADNPVPIPIPTLLSTTISGTPTTIPGYLLPNSHFATAGQTVVLGGTTTVLPTPTATGVVQVLVPTIVGAKETSTWVYVLPDGETASTGQTVTIGGTRTVVGMTGATAMATATAKGSAAVRSPARGRAVLGITAGIIALGVLYL